MRERLQLKDWTLYYLREGAWSGEELNSSALLEKSGAARAAVRDVGRALGIPYNTVDSVSKQIPRELGITIEKALQKNSELHEKARQFTVHEKLFR